MKINLFPRLVFAAVLAFTVSTFVYFSFGNTYSSTLFNSGDFKTQFESGIYQHRIISSYFIIWIYDFLVSLNLNLDSFKLKLNSPNAESAMYLAFYILNTFFLVLSSVVMILITETKTFSATASEKMLLVSLAVFTVALSQFVVVPYDVSGYFFILLFFYFMIRYTCRPSSGILLLLVFTLILSTLNRESSALSVSLAATFLFMKFGVKKEIWLPLSVLVAAFLITYCGIRYLSQTFTTNDGNLLLQNFTEPKNLLGLLFWGVFFIFPLILAKDRISVKQILIFNFLAAPYTLMCFYTGILYETRLYVPIFLTSLFLCRMVIPRHSII